MMYSWSRTINTLGDVFKLAHQSLIKLKKYEGLPYNDECEVSEINQITVPHKDTDGVNNIKSLSRNALNKTNKNILTGAIVGSVMNLATYPKNAKTLHQALISFIRPCKKNLQQFHQPGCQS